MKLGMIGPMAFTWILTTSLCGLVPAASVREFGATGDGVADDTAAIQQALDAAGGPVEIPAGHYNISDTLRIPSGGGLYGVGTIHQAADKLVLTTRDGETTSTDIRVEGVRLIKKYYENSTVSAVEFSRVQNLKIRGIEITGVALGYGLNLNIVRDFSIIDCWIHDHHSAWASAKAPNGQLWNISGIVVQHSERGQLIGNRIENLTLSPEAAAACGYETDAFEIGNCRQLIFSGNIVRNVGEGIDLMRCTDCTVTGNTFENTYGFGLKIIYDTQYSTFTGNVIRNAGLAGITLYCSDNIGNVITGNTIINTGAIGVDSDTWRTWEHAGIELVNSNQYRVLVKEPRERSVRRNLIANNVIYDDQTEPTCKWGIIERYIRYKPDRTPIFEPEPINPEGDLFTNLIRDNLVYGMKQRDYKTGSPVTP